LDFLTNAKCVRSSVCGELIIDGDDVFLVSDNFLQDELIFFERVNCCFFVLLLFDNDEIVVSSSDVSDSDVLDERIFDDLVLLITIVFRRRPIDEFFVEDTVCFDSIDCPLRD
jgi:hypothetical protein